MAGFPGHLFLELPEQSAHSQIVPTPVHARASRRQYGPRPRKQRLRLSVGVSQRRQLKQILNSPLLFAHALGEKPIMYVDSSVEPFPIAEELLGYIYRTGPEGVEGALPNLPQSARALLPSF